MTAMRMDGAPQLLLIRMVGIAAYGKQRGLSAAVWDRCAV
jgi:hypothetical protein